jgi:N-methylhydantoinase A/oxoprolinase/acetone carboxylase beta subunit
MGDAEEEPVNTESGNSASFSEDASNKTGEISPDRIIGLGIDAGGTFTDAVIYDLSGTKLLAKNKTLTTTWDYSEGISAALGRLDPVLLASVNLVALSTTLATNAIVEDKGQKVGLLFMPPYGLFEPEDITHEPKALISGRMEITGESIEPVDEEEVVQTARTMVRNHKVKAFAVSGYAGTINPDHELAVKRILKEETGLDVSCGHELSDILNFRTRAYTAIMNARIIPLLTCLLSDTEEVLRRFKIQAPVVVVRGDGTLMRGEAAREKPVETILSGPAASVAGARHLTGKSDAIVVDMGGTTTDTALLRDGQVETDRSGSCVGEHRTHVRALRIRTLGLGGDSFIAWNRDRFTIGPQRVVSMAWLGAHLPSSGQALDYILEHLNVFRNETGRMQLLIHQGGRSRLQLTEQEKEILGFLEERAYGFQELAERLGMSYWNPQIIRRLEAHHLVQRCGLTPTDVFNCRGDLALWDTDASTRMCEILSRVVDKDPTRMVDELKREMVERFALVVLKRLLDDSINPAGLEDCEVCKELIGNIFGRNGRSYNLRLEMQKPIVGIGAPIHLFLPGAASLLGAEPVLPEHADVANAVGAVTSKVVVRRKVEIRAYRGVFRIEGLPGARQFHDFEHAKSWAESSMVRLIRETARASGTAETDVAVVAENNVHTMPNGKSLFMGCSLSAELKGIPVYRDTGRNP